MTVSEVGDSDLFASAVVPKFHAELLRRWFPTVQREHIDQWAAVLRKRDFGKYYVK